MHYRVIRAVAIGFIVYFLMEAVFDLFNVKALGYVLAQYYVATKSFAAILGILAFLKTYPKEGKS